MLAGVGMFAYAYWITYSWAISVEKKIEDLERNMVHLTKHAVRIEMKQDGITS